MAWQGDERVAAYFLAANRGKRSAAIDFATAGRRGAGPQAGGQKPTSWSRISRSAASQKFGLDAATLRAANPRLIFASITGFGQDGPYADRAGYDFIIQGMGGMMSITGLPDGEPGGGPMRAGVAIADLFTGLYTAVAILAALYRPRADAARARLSTWPCSTRSWRCSPTRRRTRWSPARTRRGRATATPISCPTSRSTRPTSRSSSPSATTASSRGWRRSAAHPEWASEPVFATNAARVANRATVVPLIASIIATKPAAEWLSELEEAGIPAGPINRSARRSPIRRRCIAARGSTLAAARWASADGRLADPLRRRARRRAAAAAGARRA